MWDCCRDGCRDGWFLTERCWTGWYASGKVRGVCDLRRCIPRGCIRAGLAARSNVMTGCILTKTILAGPQRIEQFLTVRTARALGVDRALDRQHIDTGKGALKLFKEFTKIEIGKPGVDD